jgi:hypothetical protein
MRNDALLNAIQTHDIDHVARLLAAGADPNEAGKSCYGGDLDFPLHAAIGELEAFEAIGPCGPKSAGPVDVVVLLLRHGAIVKGWDVNKEGDPLLVAVVMNHIDAVRLLLAQGADPNVRDNEGDSPLRVCTDKGYLEMAQLLLLCGATKTINEWGGERAMTALGLHVEMVKLLLAYGADPQGQDVDRYTPLDCLRFVDSSEDPADQERLREIQQLLGETKST